MPHDHLAGGHVETMSGGEVQTEQDRVEAWRRRTWSIAALAACLGLIVVGRWVVPDWAWSSMLWGEAMVIGGGVLGAWIGWEIRRSTIRRRAPVVPPAASPGRPPSN